MVDRTTQFRAAFLISVLLKFLSVRRVPLVLQSEAAECGLACLAMIAGYFGRETGLTELRLQANAGGRGVTLRQLLQLAEPLRLVPHAVRLNLAEVRTLRLPCILHWNLDHFVVLEKVTASAAWIADPAEGRRRLRWEAFSQAFSGVAVELLPAPDFVQQNNAHGLRFRDLVAGSRGLGHSLAILLALSLCLQALTLLLPFYSQLVIDDVLLRGDRELMQLLAGAALLLVLLQAAFSMGRAWVVVTAATRLNLQWSARVFRHLLRLPLSFFEYRHVGDIQSRFASLTSLQQMLTRQLVEAFVDGLMTVATLLVMFAYHPQLAFLVLLSVGLYFVVRLALFSPLRNAAQEALARSADQEGFFLETLRAVLAIKCSGIEADRQTVFLRRAIAASAARIRGSRLSVWQLGVNTSVFGMQMVVVIWVGASAIINGAMTIGMLVAFLAYRSLFTERAAALIDKLFELRLARVHLERLGDIVNTAAEQDTRPPLELQRRRVPLTLAVRQLSFRHDASGPMLLRKLSFIVRPGEHIVVTGPSGSGKTTLIKILIGLVPPTAGAVLINGQSLANFGTRRYRQLAAAVMQDDQLFSGSLLDNISLFDPRPDIQRCRRCAWLADIDQAIESMPLHYFTPAGDMGSALSGGQRQRLFLARALYRRPQILFLDEFTSHLDPASEKTINARLARLPLTRIVVAHRQETIARADRQIRLQDLAGSAADAVARQA